MGTSRRVKILKTLLEDKKEKTVTIKIRMVDIHH